MTSKQKLKGNSWERDVAGMLNALCQTEEFARAPTSGAFFGGLNAAKKSGASEHAKLTLAGDLTTPADFKFTIECKNYAATGGPNPYAIMQGKSDGTLDNWLAQVTADGEFKARIPCLFFKITPKKGSYFAIPYELAHTELPSFTKYRSHDGSTWSIFSLTYIHLLDTK